MILTKFGLFAILLLIGYVSCGKLKLVAFKGPHLGFVKVKVRTPKLFGLKHHHGLGFGGGGFHGGFGGGGGFHSSGYHHHEVHESHHVGGSIGGGGGWWGK